MLWLILFVICAAIAGNAALAILRENKKHHRAGSQSLDKPSKTWLWIYIAAMVGMLACVTYGQFTRR